MSTISINMTGRIKGCKKGDEQRKIQNVYYTHPDYETYLSNKYAEMEQREQRYECIQVEDAEVVLVAYGISSRVCREAVEIAREEGFKLGLIRPITLWPFPVKAFEQAKEAKGISYRRDEYPRTDGRRCKTCNRR